MDEIIADTLDNKPVIRITCPTCYSSIHQSYGIKYGSRIRCETCHEHILVSFIVERVPP